MSELIKPWSKEKRTYTQGKIDDAARAVAKKLKAKCCVIVAFFEDGGYYHMQDGGQAPMPIDQLYRHLVAIKEAERLPEITNGSVSDEEYDNPQEFTQ